MDDGDEEAADPRRLGYPDFRGMKAFLRTFRPEVINLKA